MSASNQGVLTSIRLSRSRRADFGLQPETATDSFIFLSKFCGEIPVFPRPDNGKETVTVAAQKNISRLRTRCREFYRCRS